MKLVISVLCLIYPLSLFAFVTSSGNHLPIASTVNYPDQNILACRNRNFRENNVNHHALNYNQHLSLESDKLIMDSRGGGFVIDLNLFKKPVSSLDKNTQGTRKRFSFTRTYNRYARRSKSVQTSSASSSNVRLSSTASSSAEGKSSGQNPLQLLWKAYENQMNAKPIQTKIITSAVLCGVGDILSQILAAKGSSSFSLNIKRLLIFAGIGGAYLGPTLHVWYNTLEKIVNSKILAPLEVTKSKVRKTATMLLIDQTFGAYFVNAGMLFCIWFFTDLLNGRSPIALLIELPMKLFAEMPATMLACWKLWPLANGINFAFVPLQYRLLFTNVVAIFWNIFMSMVINK